MRALFGTAAHFCKGDPQPAGGGGRCRGEGRRNLPHLFQRWGLQGYLAHKKYPPPRTLQWGYTLDTEGPTVVLGGGVVSCERFTPVGSCFCFGRCRGEDRRDLPHLLKRWGF